MRQLFIGVCYVVATFCLMVLVLVGYALAILYTVRPEEEEAWNCWAFAVPKWLVDPVTTGLLVTKSEHAPVPHVRYVPSTVGIWVEEAVPESPRRGWRAIFDSFRFKAKIKKGMIK
jgi:hypothetical protein